MRKLWSTLWFTKHFSFWLFARLMSAFGQDTLDALFWTATEPRGRKREHFGVLFHLLVAIAYVALHSTIVLLQALTLNVAINSDNKGLLTIVISNNVSHYFAHNSEQIMNAWDRMKTFKSIM